MIYNITPKNKASILTPGQAGPGHGLARIGHVAYQSIRLDGKTN